MDECIVYRNEDDMIGGITNFARDGYKVTDIVKKAGLFIVYFKFVGA